jgi:formate dehydrogenase major subunit
VKTFLGSWPLLRQLSGDSLGRGTAARSGWSEEIEAHTTAADKVVNSICPYCAVGCAQKVYVKDDKVIQIEGDPASPISRGASAPRAAPASSWSPHPPGSPRSGTAVPTAPSGRTLSSTPRWT